MDERERFWHNFLQYRCNLIYEGGYLVFKFTGYIKKTLEGVSVENYEIWLESGGTAKVIDIFTAENHEKAKEEFLIYIGDRGRPGNGAYVLRQVIYSRRFPKGLMETTGLY